MNYLLDTHIWLWSLGLPGSLIPRVRRVLNDPADSLWLSPVSVWELVLLSEKHRVDLRTDLDTWLADSWEKAPLQEAPLTHEIAQAAGRIDLGHRDPADRLLAATARVLDLTLITADRRFAGAKGIKLLFNR